MTSSSDREKALQILLQIKNAERRYRDRAVEQFLSREELLPELVGFLSNENGFLSDRACWTLELICAQNTELLCPFADRIISCLPTVASDRRRRPMSKICSLLSAPAKGSGKHQCSLGNDSVQSVISWSFDQLIADRPVAIKVFAMQTVFHFQDREPWIRDALRNLLLENMNKESAGYRARAKKILAEI